MEKSPNDPLPDMLGSLLYEWKGRRRLLLVYQEMPICDGRGRRGLRRRREKDQDVRLGRVKGVGHNANPAYQLSILCRLGIGDWGGTDSRQLDAMSSSDR